MNFLRLNSEFLSRIREGIRRIREITGGGANGERKPARLGCRAGRLAAPEPPAAMIGATPFIEWAKRPRRTRRQFRIELFMQSRDRRKGGTLKPGADAHCRATAAKRANEGRRGRLGTRPGADGRGFLANFGQVVASVDQGGRRGEQRRTIASSPFPSSKTLPSGASEGRGEAARLHSAAPLRKPFRRARLNRLSLEAPSRL